MTFSNPIHRSAFIAIVSLGWLSPLASAAGGDWQVLFDGQDLSAWKTLQKPADAPVGWVAEDGVLAWRKGCGDLVTREEFGDFELELEWKISPGGNSGIMFRVDEADEKPWHSGPELQLLDNAGHKDGRNPVTTAGSLYGLIAPTRAAVQAAGEWNRLRLLVVGPSIRCWMNGEQVLEVVIGGEDWNSRAAKSKFAPFPGFGRKAQGRILLQDHKDPVWFRHIRIRRL